MLHFPLKGAGTGVYVDNLTRFLMKRGHQLKVLCCDHYPPKKEYPVETILFKNDNNKTFELDFDFPVLASHPLSKGSTFGELSKSQRQAYVQVLRDTIAKELSLFRPDIVHVYHGWIIASILAEFNIPYIVSLHGTEYHAFDKYEDYRETILYGIHHAEMIISLTNNEKRQSILRYDEDDRKITIIPLSVDTNVFRSLEVDKAVLLKSFSIAETNRPIVFLGGRLTAQKGVDVLLNAAHLYSRCDLRPLTLIAGDGDLRPYLMQLASKLQLDSVYFLGQIDHEKMVALYNIADIVAIPSIFEPLPLSAMEALACGTPVVASDVGGLRQIINEQIGYLVRSGDYAALSRKITTAIKDDFKEKVREQAIAYIKQNYALDKIGITTETLYQQVLAL